MFKFPKPAPAAYPGPSTASTASGPPPPTAHDDARAREESATGCWSFLMRGLRSRAGSWATSATAHPPANDFAVVPDDPSTTAPQAVCSRSVSLRPAHYRQEVKALEKTLRDAIHDPAFRIDRRFGQMRCELHLRHPRAEDTVNSYSVKRLGDYYLKYDHGLNGRTLPRFDPFAILRQQLAQTVLAQIGLGPVAGIAICRNQAMQESPYSPGIASGRPVAITASRALAGTEFEIFLNPEKTAAFIRRPELRSPLAAAFVLGMNDVVKLEKGSVHNLVHDPKQGRWWLIDGFDTSAAALAPAMLGERSISALFGMSRQDLSKILDKAAAGTRSFAAANATALRHVDTTMVGHPHATAPLACFDEYLQGCRQRIAELAD